MEPINSQSQISDKCLSPLFQRDFGVVFEFANAKYKFDYADSIIRATWPTILNSHIWLLPVNAYLCI